jgi:hypothetical protein
MTHEFQSLECSDGSRNWILTRHGAVRANARGIPLDGVAAVVAYGRAVHTRRSVTFAVGRKEVARARRDKVDLSALEGVRVVCDPAGYVLTTYRNHDFSDLKPGRHYRRPRRGLGAGRRRVGRA